MTTVRLVFGSPHVGGPYVPLIDAFGAASRLPSLLVSFFYLDGFKSVRDRIAFSDWAFDSGAYSALNSGATIDLDAYIAACQEYRATDPQLAEVFTLDVIGDWRASRKNTERMWAAGVEAIPVYHINEPQSVLKGLAQEYPKIALGGAAMLRTSVKNEWAEQCFARVWPKRIHGFGFGSEKSILHLPFESVDATSWETGPARFGRWKAYGKMSSKGAGLNLRTEVEWYLRLEERARLRWAKEMQLIGAPSGSPVNRFVTGSTNDQRLNQAFGMEIREGHMGHRRKQ